MMRTPSAKWGGSTLRLSIARSLVQGKAEREAQRAMVRMVRPKVRPVKDYRVVPGRFRPQSRPRAPGTSDTAPGFLLGRCSTRPARDKGVLAMTDPDHQVSPGSNGVPPPVLTKREARSAV